MYDLRELRSAHTHLVSAKRRGIRGAGNARTQAERLYWFLRPSGVENLELPPRNSRAERVCSRGDTKERTLLQSERRLAATASVGTATARAVGAAPSGAAARSATGTRTVTRCRSRADLLFPIEKPLSRKVRFRRAVAESRLAAQAWGDHLGIEGRSACVSLLFSPRGQTERQRERERERDPLGDRELARHTKPTKPTT